MIAIGPIVGIALIAVFIALDILAPLLVRARLEGRRQKAGATASPVASDEAPPPETTGVREPITQMVLAAIVVGMARKRAILLPLALVITVAAISFALKLEATFDVKDFFDNGSDFVVSLDKLDEHVGETAGERLAVGLPILGKCSGTGICAGVFWAAVRSWYTASKHNRQHS